MKAENSEAQGKIKPEKKLLVYLYGNQAGTLTQTSTGDMQFEYSGDEAHALSLSLPIHKEPYRGKVCDAYFGGLLPESFGTRDAIGRLFGVNARNNFSLLKAIAGDCPGAVSLYANADEALEANDFKLEQKLLKNKADIAAFIHSLPQKPLGLGATEKPQELRLSLAGAQDKAGVLFLNEQLAVPVSNCPCTHILKPAIKLLADSVFNEYFCMTLAKRLGLQVANVRAFQVTDKSSEKLDYLLVERYDRQVSKDAKGIQHITRFHQEDFCQALGILSADKYQIDGGPDIAQCFQVLEQTTTPILERNRLAELIVFNYLIGNTDAHGKNFSLLWKKEGNGYHITLTPAYDLLSARIYENVSRKMAMKIGSENKGEYDIENVRPEHWEELCKIIKYSPPALAKIIAKQCRTIPELASDLANDMKQKFTGSQDFCGKILTFLDTHTKKNMQYWGF